MIDLSFLLIPLLVIADFLAIKDLIKRRQYLNRKKIL